KGSNQDRLEDMPRATRVGFAVRHRGNAFLLELFCNAEELIEGLGRLETVLLKNFLVVPEDIGPVDVDGHGPLVAVPRSDSQELLRKSRGEAPFLVETF